MSEPKHEVNPFEAAKARPEACIMLSWSAEDLQTRRPDWSRQRCEAFMRRNARLFAAGVLQIGMDILVGMTRDPKYADEKPPP